MKLLTVSRFFLKLFNLLNYLFMDSYFICKFYLKFLFLLPITILNNDLLCNWVFSPMCIEIPL